MQKQVSIFLKSQRDPAVPRARLQARIIQWLPSIDASQVELQASRCRWLTSRGLHSLVYNILRSSARGWCTSHRFRGSRCRLCVFGCQEWDRFQHYLECPRLWSGRILHDFRCLDLDLLPVQRMARLLLLSPRPVLHAGCLDWDIAAASVVEAIHFAFSVRQRKSGPAADARTIVKARLAELARRHRIVHEAFLSLQFAR